MKQIMAFSVIDDASVERFFKINGEVEISKNYKGDVIAEYCDLSAVEVVGEQEISYQPSARTFAGRQFDEFDMIEDVVKKVVMRDGNYRIQECCDELRQLIDGCLANSVEVNGKQHALKIPVGSDVYELDLITESNIFYSYDEQTIMLDAQDNQIIADNYFAEVGLCDVIEEIQAGETQSLWMSDNMQYNINAMEMGL